MGYTNQEAKIMRKLNKMYDEVQDIQNDILSFHRNKRVGSRLVKQLDEIIMILDWIADTMESES